MKPNDKPSFEGLCDDTGIPHVVDGVDVTELMMKWAEQMAGHRQIIDRQRKAGLRPKSGDLAQSRLASLNNMGMAFYSDPAAIKLLCDPENVRQLAQRILRLGLDKGYDGGPTY
ncbi:MAG: hypothetical protein OEY44_03540 [Candidatus Peregrinibacteria bacterium]|nr:hypothetical protein [Candidatus Peregrinibacteria bacterium]